MLLCDFVTNHSRRKPSEVFARQGSRQITLEEAAERIDRFAGALIGEGAVVGDRIGYLSKNDIDMAIMFLAAGRVGVVAVPLNYRLSAAELSAIVSDAKIKLFFAHSAFLSVADAFRSEQLGSRQTHRAAPAGPIWNHGSILIPRFLAIIPGLMSATSRARCTRAERQGGQRA